MRGKERDYVISNTYITIDRKTAKDAKQINIFKVEFAHIFQPTTNSDSNSIQKL